MKACRPKPVRRVPPKKALKFAGLFLLILVSLFAGSLAGAALVQKFPALSGSPGFDRAEIDKSIADLQKSQSAQTAKLNRLEQSFEKAPGEDHSQKISGVEARLASLENAAQDISAFETRITALEAGTIAAESGIDFADIDARLKALENSAPQGEIADDIEKPTAEFDMAPIEDRIAALEGRLSSIELPEDTDPNRIADIETRIAALENAEPAAMPDVPAAIAPLLARLDALEAKASAAPLLIPPFPKQAVLDAMVEAGSGKKGNWFQRVVDSQITVVDDAHIETVNDITNLVEAGDVKTALKKIETCRAKRKMPRRNGWMPLQYRIRNDQICRRNTRFYRRAGGLSAVCR